MEEFPKCVVNVVGPPGSGKTTLMNSIVRFNSKNEQDILFSKRWNIYEESFHVPVESREFDSIESYFLQSTTRIFEKEIFIILFGFENILKNSLEQQQYWISEINQVSPNSIVIIVYYIHKVNHSLRFEQLKSRFSIIRDVFEVLDLQGKEMQSLSHYLKDIILNEFTNRLEFVKEKIRTNVLNRDTILDLGKCYLTSLYEIPQIFECTHLVQLVLSNEWAEYKSGKWRRIESENNGGRNRFRYLPRELQKLQGLKVLIAGGDWNFGNKEIYQWSIKDVNWLRNLYNLEFLNISNNEIRSFPDINRLKKIRVLHLNNNKISKVTSLKKLAKLEEVYISNNLIKDISFLADVNEIKTLDLHSNLITDISILKPLIERLNITNSKWEPNTINIAINPLETPPVEIINTGKEAVLLYFRDIQLDKPFINDEVKVILVGNSEVGKTTLAKYLDNEKDLEQPHDPTLWMEEKHIQSKYVIKKIKLKCTINLFDFGGHDYYHDTHHLLFGTNCLYIILWDKETNHLNFRSTYQKFNGKKIKVQVQDYPLKYWLDSVKHFSKGIETENFAFEVEKKLVHSSLALVIQNKVNSFEEIVHLNNQNIKENYAFVFDFLNMSIINRKRNLEYFDSIFTNMLEEGNLVGAKLPGYYGVVKESLINYQGKAVLSIGDFMNYCNGLLKSPITLTQTRFLVHYLKQLGIVLFYPKDSLDDKVFIKKDWILRSIYILFERLPEKGGEFKDSYVFETLKSHLSDVEILIFIELLLEFKVIFKHPVADSYIAPLYLPITPASTVKMFTDEIKIPYRRFIYNGFIHKNVTLRLFQEYGKLVLAETKNFAHFSYYWKDGLIVKDPSTGELILIQFFIGDNEGNAFIDIIKLNKYDKTNFSENLISFIKEINTNYDIEEMVTVDGSSFVSLDILNENAKNGKLIFTEKSKNELQLKKPTITYYKLKDFVMYLNDGIKRKKVVISYSKKDLTRVHDFIRYLKPLVDLELIEQPWYCTLSNPGDVWDEKIQGKFKEADIVFFMVSEYFYSTDYIINKEIKTTINRYDFDKSVKIIPIILEHYDWERKHPYNLKRFSAMPFQAKPISDFNNEKLAWNTITSAVRKMIEMDLDPGDTEVISREMQEFYERQVEGKLDRNS